MRIFIDAGHGGTNPGTIGVNGLKESTVNLDVALKLGRILQNNGYTVNYSRTTDVNLSLARRANLANEWGADYFISIHCNSNPDPDIGGTSTFYYRNGTVAESFAIVVNTNLVRLIELRNIGTYPANFAVLRRTSMPAILVELAFLSNPREAALLATNSFRENCALGIANGVIQFTS